MYIGSSLCESDSHEHAETIINFNALAQLRCKTDQLTVKVWTNIPNISRSVYFGISDIKLYGENRCPEECNCCLKEAAGSVCLECEAASSICTEDYTLIATDLTSGFSDWVDQDGVPVASSDCRGEEILGGSSLS